MRLTTRQRRDGLRHRLIRCAGSKQWSIAIDSSRHIVGYGIGIRTSRLACIQRVRMRWNLLLCQRDVWRTAAFPKLISR